MLKKTDLDKGEVLVTPVTDESPFTFSLETTQHSIIADEPKELGGGDQGMAPFDFLSSSLATCTAMTLRFYAKRENIDLGRFQVKVSTKKVVDEATKENVFNFFTEVIFWDIQDEQLLTRLNSVANQCPVHKTLKGRININTKVNSGKN